MKSRRTSFLFPCTTLLNFFLLCPVVAANPPTFPAKQNEKSNGMTVVKGTDGDRWALVASVEYNQSVVSAKPSTWACDALEVAKIPCLGSANHGICGIYVLEAKAKKAATILRRDAHKHGYRIAIYFRKPDMIKRKQR